MMPLHDPSVDWTYSIGCGCKITFTGESLNHTSRMTCCSQHRGSGTADMNWRTVFVNQARWELQKATLWEPKTCEPTTQEGT